MEGRREAGHLWVDWATYDRKVEELMVAIRDSGWRFGQVLCLARGGLRPGDAISRVFGVPLAVMSTSSYREGGGTVRGELDISCSVAMAKGELGGNVLLVDDLVDSGVTLGKVVKHLARAYPKVEEVRTAVVWWKACSETAPDYHVEYLADNPWIHQPFEAYDALRPEGLEEWMRRARR